MEGKKNSGLTKMEKKLGSLNIIRMDIRWKRLVIKVRTRWDI